MTTNKEQRCDKCMAHNISESHTCDPLMCVLKENADKKRAHKDWREEFDRIFIEENYWQGEDSLTKNVAVGNIKEFIERTLQQQRRSDQEELEKKVGALKVDVRPEIKVWTINKSREEALAFNEGIDAALSLIKDTKPQK